MRFSFAARVVLLVVAIGGVTQSIALGQSTFGTILGTVRDQSGGVMPGCAVTVENVGTSLRRSVLTDETGSYTASNLEPGTYKVKVELPGFQVAEYTSIQLTARQTVRIDGTLRVATQAETVSVTAEAAPVVNTEVSNIAETKSGQELADLPIALAARSG